MGSSKPSGAETLATLRVDSAGLPHIFLQPGGLYFTAKPAVVTTVLGSCVAVCLLAPQQRCCSINHFVLPYCGTAAPSLRYGDLSLAEMLSAMKRHGCAMKDLQAKVFGGAAVLPTGSPEFNVGTRNSDFAFKSMQALGVPVIASCTGGRRGMLIRLFTSTGEVFVRPVRSAADRR